MFTSVSLFNHTVHFLLKETKIQWQILKGKKNRCGMIENRSQDVESMVRSLSLTTITRNTRCYTEFDFHSYSTNRYPK